MRCRDDSSVKGSPVVGARARLRRRVERLPHFVIEVGATGAISASTESLIALRMDEPVVGAEEWVNEVCWTAEDVASGRLPAAFYDDAETFGDDQTERTVEGAALANLIESSRGLTMSELLAELNELVEKGHARRTLEVERAVVELIVLDLVRREGSLLVPTPAALRVGELELGL